MENREDETDEGDDGGEECGGSAEKIDGIGEVELFERISGDGECTSCFGFSPASSETVSVSNTTISSSEVGALGVVSKLNFPRLRGRDIIPRVSVRKSINASLPVLFLLLSSSSFASASSISCNLSCTALTKFSSSNSRIGCIDTRSLILFLRTLRNRCMVFILWFLVRRP